MSTLRIIIVAENASRKMGGEAILPYHYFRILRSRGVDAWLVVHERTRKELESLFPYDLDRICFIPDKLLQKLFFHIGRRLHRRIAENTFGLANQLLTQWSQRAAVRSLTTPCSVVHQPIPVSPRSPSLLWNVGAPVVIGPLNGGMEYPPALQQQEPAASRMVTAVGRALSNAVNVLLPGKRRAAVVLVANERTRAALPSGIQGRIVLIPENGVTLSQWPPASAISTSNPAPHAARFLFMGRLVDWKALDIVIEALLHVPDATLDVIGDGPSFSPWQKLAIRLELTDRIHFHGWVPQDQCARHLAESRALLLPSLLECGGAVVLEAMAMSKPVIATAWGGPTDYLDSTCGILIPPTSREALVSGFASAMQLLAASPELACQLGATGRARVTQHYDWDKKVDAILAAYDSVLPAITAAA